MSDTPKPEDVTPRSLTPRDAEAIVRTVIKSVATVLRERFTIFEQRLEVLETSGDEKRVIRDASGRIERLVGGSATAQELRDQVKSLAATVDALTRRVEAAESVSRNFGYRGVWKEGTVYKRSNFVTIDGGLWHCESDGVTSRPGRDTCWKLAVKKNSLSP